MTFPNAYADSDADDEYERSVMTSPHLPTDDDDTSPTNSDPPSNEHTPTTFENADGGSSPRTIISEWTTDECAQYIASLGLAQYCDKFMENEIVGEALIALQHEELKEMGVTSMGHRLTILKGVYDVKMKQDIPVDPDHYIPLSADATTHDKTATQEDISRIIQSIKMRDERILQAESELRKVTEDYRRLREELLPIFRYAKERSQPLPFPSASSPDVQSHEGMPSPVSAQPLQNPLRDLGRKLSKKGPQWLGPTPKNSSPTHIPQSIPEGKIVSEGSNVEASAAVTAVSGQLMSGGGPQPSYSPSQISMPSPTSPNTNQHYPPISTRSNYSTSRDGTTPGIGRSQHPSHGEEVPSTLPPNQYLPPGSTANGGGTYDRTAPTPISGRPRANPRDQDDSPSSGGREPPVEIFKSFRVSMDDPCWKVLPAALKKYQINADWKQYALYIVFGDQERCLGLDEKPLILFKQLDKEGRKPMFMLRRHAAPAEGHSGPSGIGGIGGMGGMGFDIGSSLGGSRGHQSSLQLPGGVL